MQEQVINFSSLLPLEKELLITIEQYPVIIEQAAADYNPSHIANYVYSVAKIFSSFYSEHKVANAETEEKKQLRLRLVPDEQPILLLRGWVCWELG